MAVAFTYHFLFSLTARERDQTERSRAGLNLKTYPNEQIIKESELNKF